MKANWLPLSAAVALALSSVAASAVDFHSYLRAGAQANTNGGNVYCLGTGEKGHKVGRLGDESYISHLNIVNFVPQYLSIKY